MSTHPGERHRIADLLLRRLFFQIYRLVMVHYVISFSFRKTIQLTMHANLSRRVNDLKTFECEPLEILEGENFKN